MDTFKTNNGALHICADNSALVHELAEHFVELSQECIASQGRFIVALSGGSTPASLYCALAQPPYRDRIAWDKVHFFWGDERCVSHQNTDSNYRMAQQVLLSKVPISAMNIHPTVGQDENPARCADNYEDTVRAVLNTKPGALPIFDLILLGIGTEGHTASIFPGSSAGKQHQRLVMAVYVDQLKADRITFTPLLINAARNIVFMVEGSQKKDILAHIFEQAELKLPAQLIKPNQGALDWFVDRQAAAELSFVRSKT